MKGLTGPDYIPESSNACLQCSTLESMKKSVANSNATSTAICEAAVLASTSAAVSLPTTPFKQCSIHHHHHADIFLDEPPENLFDLIESRVLT